MIEIKDWKTAAVLVAGVAVAYFVLKSETKNALAAISDPKNPVNQGFEKTYQAVTGSTSGPGDDIYSWLHDENDQPANGWVYLLDMGLGLK